MTTISKFGKIYTHALKLAPTATTKLVYATLTTFADANTREAFPKHETIAEIVGVSVRTIERSIADLKKVGLIEVVGYKTYPNGYKSANVYKLLDSYPSPVSGEIADETISPAIPDVSHPTPVSGQEQTIEHTNTTTTNKQLPRVKKSKPKIRARKLTKSRMKKLVPSSSVAFSSSVPSSSSAFNDSGSSRRKFKANSIDILEHIESNGSCSVDEIIRFGTFTNEPSDIEQMVSVLSRRNRIVADGDRWMVR